MSRLPATVEDLRGLRAARWIRESTAGQFAQYGPDVQRDQASRAIARLGLIDTGLAWSPAHSGSTVHGSPAMRAMLEAAAAGEFDVLVVARSDRWQRNLRWTLQLLEDDLHPAGVVVWFDDEELLSSNDRHWDQLVDEAKGADSWLRKHRRRVTEGLAAKLREKRDPGGHPPFGFRRDAAKLIEPDPDHRSLVQRTYELAAARLTDRQVAGETGLTIHVVRGMLRSTIYAGRLPDGRPTRFPPVVAPALWNEVQAVRETRRTRDGSPAPPAPLRTVDAPLRRVRPPADRRHRALPSWRCMRGLPRGAPNAEAATSRPAHRGPRLELRGRRLRAPGRHGPRGGLPWRRRAHRGDRRHATRRGRAGSRRGRIERDRDQALERYRRTRNAAELERAMARLDTEATLARTADVVEPLSPEEAAAYLRDLPRLWSDAPRSRRALAESLFESIEVLGLRTMRISPTRAAVDRGLVDAFHARSGGYGRGERASPSLTQQSLRFLMINRTPRESLPATARSA